MYLESSPRDRVRAAAPALAVHALLALLILRGLGVTPAFAPPDTLRLIDLTPPPPPAPVARPLQERSEGGRREGAAAPANREARPNEIMAPPPPVPMPVPPAPPVASRDMAPASADDDGQLAFVVELDRALRPDDGRAGRNEG